MLPTKCVYVPSWIPIVPATSICKQVKQKTSYGNPSHASFDLMYVHM